MQIKNLPIGRRLALGFGIVLLLTTVSSGIGLWRLNTIANSTHAMMEAPLKKERMTAEWYRITTAGLRRTLAIVKSSDDSLTDFFAKDAKESTTRNNEIQKYMEEHVGNSEEKKLLDSIISVRKEYIDVRTKLTQAKKEGNADEVTKLFEKFIPLSEAYQQSELNFLEFQQKAVDNLSQEVDVIAVNSRRLIFALIAGSLLIGGLFAWSLTRGITQPLNNAVQFARRVAAGDLSGEIHASSNDEIGQLVSALDEMNRNLGDIVNNVRESTDLIVTASTEIATGNMDLSARTESQAGSLEETASSMEELNSTMQQNSQNAKEANQVVQSASAAAIKGGAVVTQVVDTMNSISDSSKKIVDIIAVIDGIAFQTNILALNAAVEAARAGEQGRGFAVVASEVRSLAQRSASAAKEIKTLIDDSVSKVNQGTQLVDQAGTAMTEIVERVKQANDIMTEINHASNEQSAGIEQVNQAIIQMDGVTQQNAALVEEAAAAAQSLQDQAGSLANAVSIFKLRHQDVRRAQNDSVQKHSSYRTSYLK